MLTAIRNWVIRTMMKAKGETGIVKTLPKKEIVDINTQITVQRLMENGIDPRSLKNTDQVENAIISIENKQKANLAENIRGGIRDTKTAKVFNIKGEELDPKEPIIGGTQPGKKIDTDAFIRNAEIKTKLEKQNKESVAKIRQRMVDEAIDNMSPSLSGDIRTDAELVAEDLASRMGKVYDDMPTKERLKLYEESYSGLSKQRFKNRKKPDDADDPNYDAEPADFDPDADNETFATGGRAGFANGTGAPSITLGPKEEPMGPVFETNDPGEAAKEIIKRLIRVEGAQIPLTEKGLLSLNIDILDKQSLGGIIDLLGGELQFGVGRDEGGRGAGFTFRKQFADGGRIGYFMGSANPKGLGLLREILKNMSKKGKELDKFKGADLSALDMLRLSNPKALNRLLEDVRGKVNVREGIMGTDTVRAQQQALRKQRKGLTEAALDVAKEMKVRDDAIAKRIAEEAEKTIIPRTKKMMMEGMGMSEEAAEKAARDLAKAGQNMRLIDDSPQITDEGILQLENVLKNMETGGKKKRELNATGGRTGFKDGMTRRTFLKILGGVMSIPIIGKIVKPLKLTTGVKKVPIIKTDDVPGKPEWFDQLVNKVIIEGDDVTKTFATGERQSIHQKTLDDGSVVRVTEDIDDGAVRVEYESETNVFGDTATMQYKKPLPDEADPRPTAEFEVAESGPVGRSMGPDDYEIDVDEVGGTSIRDLDSDVSKLKEYATGKKLTMKEIVESKKRRDKAKAITEDPEAQSDAVIRRQGDADDSYYGDPDEFASGGIARMLGE